MMYTKKGFTLFEIVVVLALIGIFIVGTSYMTQDSRIDQTRAERLANTIHDTIRTARNNMIIGRGVLSGSTMVVTNRREVHITSTRVETIYTYGSTSTGSESILVSPFFDADSKYLIMDISASSGTISPGGLMPDWGLTGATDAKITFDANGDIAITTTPSFPEARLLRITASYNGLQKSIVFDRVSGTTSIPQITGVAVVPSSVVVTPQPVNGNWGEYGLCSVSCGIGIQTRVCDSPAPGPGGAGCPGSATLACTLQPCLPSACTIGSGLIDACVIGS